jgi:hypothetical protein
VKPVTLQTGYMRADFDDLLDSREFAYREAVTFRLRDGSVLVYTNASQDFTVPPCDGSLALQTYVANDVQIGGLKFRISNGCAITSGDPQTSLEVDEQSVTLTPQPITAEFPSVIAGVPFMQAVKWGALRGAVVQWDTWFGAMSPAFAPLGGVKMFYGLASSLGKQSRTQVELKVKSGIVLLNQEMPRNRYQANCQYNVYAAGCGADPATFGVHDVVGASPSQAFIPWASATAQFGQGKLFIESGPNTNVTRTILRADNTGLWLAYPLPYLPLAGDMFVAYPGCNRLDPLANPVTSGCVFFGRQAAFRATPKVPPANFAI